MTVEQRSPAWPWIGHACALAVGAFFMYYAVGKMGPAGGNQFATDISFFHILPVRWTNLFAIFLPWWEAVAAIALIVPRTRRPGAILIAGMLLMFIGAVGIAMYNGYDISCGCSGKDSGKAGWPTIGRNALLLAGTGLAYFGVRPTTQLRQGVVAESNE